MSVIKPKDIDELNILLENIDEKKKVKKKKSKKKKKHNKSNKNKKNKSTKKNHKKKKKNKNKNTSKKKTQNNMIDSSAMKLADQMYSYRSTKNIFHRFLDMFDLKINTDVGINVKDETLSNAISAAVALASKFITKK